MGLLTLIQIPCHHVLANEIALNLKYRTALKHFFNINLGIGIIKKLFFCSYSRHISLYFYSNFDRERHHHHVFSVIYFFVVEGSVKSMPSGYPLDVEFNCTSNELSQLKFEEKHAQICRKCNKKQFRSFLPSKLIHIILLF